MGALANVQGQPDKALAFYGESIPRFEKVGHKRGLAEAYHNIGMTYSDLERWSEADDNYNKSEILDILELERPDKVPPLAPFLNHPIATDSAIILSWTSQQSGKVGVDHCFSTHLNLDSSTSRSS